MTRRDLRRSWELAMRLAECDHANVFRLGTGGSVIVCRFCGALAEADGPLELVDGKPRAIFHRPIAVEIARDIDAS